MVIIALLIALALIEGATLIRSKILNRFWNPWQIISSSSLLLNIVWFLTSVSALVTSISRKCCRFIETSIIVFEMRCVYKWHDSLCAAVSPHLGQAAAATLVEQIMMMVLVGSVCCFEQITRRASWLLEAQRGSECDFLLDMASIDVHDFFHMLSHHLLRYSMVIIGFFIHWYYLLLTFLLWSTFIEQRGWFFHRHLDHSTTVRGFLLVYLFGVIFATL